MPQSEDRTKGQGRAESANRERARDARTGSDAAEVRVRHQTHWVDLQIKRAMERGEFDDLPGRGKPVG